MIDEVIGESLADESVGSLLERLRATSEVRRKADEMVGELLVEARSVVDLLWGAADLVTPMPSLARRSASHLKRYDNGCDGPSDTSSERDDPALGNNPVAVRP
ncbi:hypothetical protein [Lentzea sp.]|uniref:hypothetical protein n=1 Tax=Lentzea sp. TaxID=56099 RepID=UPI002CD22FBC|nr:hypothetical protein [Lentzea sp.]HUQ59034.1 hypothetical protein [Lentzea sp.]